MSCDVLCPFVVIRAKLAQVPQPNNPPNNSAINLANNRHHHHQRSPVRGTMHDPHRVVIGPTCADPTVLIGIQATMNRHRMDPSVTAAGHGTLRKKCRVCGDKALAFNFNGLSCESCKAFFRRNALRKEDLTCLQEGDCEIDMATRKFCPRCRLDKCFAIGMRKELVMTREEKSDRKRSNTSQLKAKQSRDKAELSPNHNVLTSDQAKTSPIHDSLSSHLEHSDCNDDDLNRGSPTPPASLSPSEQSSVNTSAPIDFDLGCFELERFEEVKCASLVFLNRSPMTNCDETLKTLPNSPRRTEEESQSSGLLQAFRLQEDYIRKILQFCRSLAAFRCLKKTDQLVIVKGFFTESLTIRCAFNFDADQDGFPVKGLQPKNTNNNQSTQECSEELSNKLTIVRMDAIFPPDKHHCLDGYRKFIHSLHQELEGDKYLRDLLITVAIFRPNKETGNTTIDTANTVNDASDTEISCPEFIRYHYFVYCRLLLRYLEQKYRDPGRAGAKFSRLLATLDRMWRVRQLIQDTYMDIDCGLVTHVLGEIYQIDHFHPLLPSAAANAQTITTR